MKTHLFSPATLAAQCDLVSQRIVTDPQNGSSWVLTYEGSEWGVKAMGATLLAYGAKIETDVDGGKSKLVATFSKDPATASDPTIETPNVKWDLDWEMVQVSIWGSYKVINELVYDLNPAETKKLIVDAASNGQKFPFAKSVYPACYEVFCKLVAGGEYIEIPRPVLTRIRTYSPKYASRFRVSQRQFAYTTPTLISTFEVPADVQLTLPEDPPLTETPLRKVDPDVAGSATEPMGIWSWKLRGLRIAYQSATRRFEESATWAFSAWDKDLYIIT
jgi:hypothetical protein